MNSPDRVNPFAAAVQAKRTLLEMFPALQVQVVLGPKGPFLEVQPTALQVPGKINGFQVVAL